MTTSSKIRYYFANIFIALLIFASGIYVGFNKQVKISEAVSVASEKNEIENSVDFSSFWKVWNTIDTKYPGAEKVSNEERVYGAISGLLDSLDDPYSVFFPPAEAKIFEEDISGNFTGVGMEVGRKDKILTVIAPLKDTPAYRAGIKSGDRILKIDGHDTTDLSAEIAVKLIRGDKGTTVTLTIFREGEKAPREIKIVRDIISMPTIDTELRSDGIFVIKLYSFSSNSIGLFRNAITKFKESKSNKLLLDLRGNPGGYLNAAIDMASWFLPSGKTVVIEDSGANGGQKMLRSKGYDLLKNKLADLKFVILIDGGSASASEILAGAMQDHKVAKIVGAQSFGKGSVQEVVKMDKGTLLKITIAKWLTPNGVSISEKGLTPDYVVDVTKNSDSKKDLILEKGIELLK
ncbi:S41 family peptidase [Candidatus Nomurabacteria bacterium]|nr:S41 family peptidase [Candidatus Nomurabacteria bacterium]